MHHPSLPLLAAVALLGFGLVLGPTLVTSASADYVDVILADQPVGYWRFEEASTANGAIAVNSGTSGAADHGVYQGSVTATASLPGLGRAANFNGTSARVDLDFDLRDSLDGASAVSVEAWVRNDTLPGSTTSYFLFGNSLGDTATAVRLAINPTDPAMNMNLGGRAALGETFVSAGASYADTGHWHHVVGVMDILHDQIDIYVDGVRTSTSVAFTATSYTKNDTNKRRDGIGASTNGEGDAWERFFDGLLDEVAVYRYDLGDPNGDGDTSDSRVAAHFAAAMGVPEPATGLLLAVGLLSGLLMLRAGRSSGSERFV